MNKQRTFDEIFEESNVRWADAWKALAEGDNMKSETIFVCRHECKGNSAIYVADTIEKVLQEAARVIALTVNFWLGETPDSSDFPYNEPPVIDMLAIIKDYEEGLFANVVSRYTNETSGYVLGEYTDMWIDIYEDCDIH
jgi:hypothetical protein